MITEQKDKELLVKMLTERLSSGCDLEEKERILSLLQRMKRRSNSGFQSRGELAQHYGISTRALFRNITKRIKLVEELQDTGWNVKKSGFFPIQIAIIQKHLGL